VREILAGKTLHAINEMAIKGMKLWIRLVSFPFDNLLRSTVEEIHEATVTNGNGLLHDILLSHHALG
jgi:hypothetical protein